MNKEIMIGNRRISEDAPTFVIAEMSANHLMDFDRAVAIMQAAKDAGADAIKIQTYTPDTITLDCDDPCFQITQGTIWDGTTLHKLYETAYTARSPAPANRSSCPRELLIWRISNWHCAPVRKKAMRT